MKIKWICILLIFELTTLFGKKRLPETINEYQPAIFPVISLDGKELFLDMKWNPLNTGGIYDDDDIYVANKLDSFNWGKPVKLPQEINRPESNILFYLFPDGNKALVYGKYKKDELSTDSIENSFTLAITRKIEGKWTKPVPLKIQNFYNKSKNYSATISADGKVLIFSLEREDSYGSLDLYISFYNEITQSYSEPKNLGQILNTKGTELAAYLALDNQTLYFSSTGKNGKGKLDLYYSRREEGSWFQWSKSISLDSGINSQFDESSLSLNVWADTIYFTSGDTISGKPGIYLAPLPKDYQPLPYLVVQGKITSQQQKIIQPIYFKIDNFDTDEIFYDTVFNGEFRYAVPFNTQYNFFISAKGYNDFSFTASSKKLTEVKVLNYDINLTPEVSFEEKGSNRIEQENLHEKEKLIATVYFETNIDTLNSLGIETILSLKPILKEAKFKKMLVVGHTDEVGTEEYNNLLSKRRAINTAKALSKYLKIPSKKIVSIGKGKSQPVSTENNKNRRAEIYLITQ